MSRVINSPGVELREKDTSLRAPTQAGTTVYVTGFADQGPTDEVVSPSSLSEFTTIYGQPTNASERYFHHTARLLYQSSANLLVNRLPWGADSGDGFGSRVGLLAYPVVALSSTSDFTTTSACNLDQSGQVTYITGEPVHFDITSTEYRDFLNGNVDGNAFTWSAKASATSDITALSTVGGAGILVFNDSQTVIDNKYSGRYIGFSDNTNINPASAYDAVVGVKTITSDTAITGSTTYTSVPQSRLAFAMSATEAGGSNPRINSVSEVMEEKIVDYDTSTSSFDDTLNIGMFKLRQSTFLTNATTLDYTLEEAYNASIGVSRQIYNQQGGTPVNFFMESVINDSSNNMHVVVNPYISKKLSTVELNSDGTPKNKIRVLTQQLADNVANDNIPADRAGFADTGISIAEASLSKADNLYPIGAYSESYASDTTTKDCGNVPSKIERALNQVRNDEVYDIDIVVEGGLGTIWTGLTGGTFYFDDQANADVDGLRSSTPVLENTAARDRYMAVYNKFMTLAGPSQDGGRGDLLFVADPIRQILVTGTDNKVVNDKSRVFTTDVYWALRHQYELADTSYATVPCNWVKVFDDYSGQNVWAPASGAAAALMASTDALIGPWSAPAGFNRGGIRGVADIAFTPNQRQRDDLYKVNLNPIAQFPNQGIVMFGQKTLSKKPSAFDRINVRRLFLYLEKSTKKTMQYFVFEPNSIFTRSRVVNTLTPLFDRVKAAEGIYDYIIICDERNNTPDIIDQNELVVDIYIKPTRTAEFITVNFVATRTDTNFEEVVS